MAKYTPGPWRIGVRQPTSDKFIYGNLGEEIADCDRLLNFSDDNLANARLIAQAPAMLDSLVTMTEALRLMVRDNPSHPMARHCLDIIETAIARNMTGVAV
jgi:hypothetical protein